MSAHTQQPSQASSHQSTASVEGEDVVAALFQRKVRKCCTQNVMAMMMMMVVRQNKALQQLDIGIYTCKRSHEFVLSMAKLCEQFSNGMRRLLADQQKKSGNQMLAHDQTEGATVFWNTLVESAKFLADNHQSSAVKMATEIANPVLSMYHHLGQQRRCVELINREQVVDMSGVRHRFQKEKKRCVKKLKALNTSAANVVASRESSSMFKRMTRKRNQRSLDAHRADASKAFHRYQRDIEKVNADLHEIELHVVLPVVQKVNHTERHRLELFKDAIGVLKDVVAQCAPEPLHNRFDSCSEMLGTSISYLSSAIAQPSAAFAYDLPCKAADFDTFSWPDCPLRENGVSENDVSAVQTEEGAPEKEDEKAGARAAEVEPGPEPEPEPEEVEEEEEEVIDVDVPRLESDSDSEGHESILRPSSKDSFKRARKLVEELLEGNRSASKTQSSLPRRRASTATATLEHLQMSRAGPRRTRQRPTPKSFKES